jgi:hypothetical protein
MTISGEKGMRSVIRKGGQTRPGPTAVTLEREITRLVFKAVPAEICAYCGEAYVAEEVSGQILAAAGPAARSGVQAGVPEFVGGDRRKATRLAARGTAVADIKSNVGGTSETVPPRRQIQQNNHQS